jgi:hypothetical protein
MQVHALQRTSRSSLKILAAHTRFLLKFSFRNYSALN